MVTYAIKFDFDLLDAEPVDNDRILLNGYEFQVDPSDIDDFNTYGYDNIHLLGYLVAALVDQQSDGEMCMQELFDYDTSQYEWFISCRDPQSPYYDDMVQSFLDTFQTGLRIADAVKSYRVGDDQRQTNIY